MLPSAFWMVINYVCNNRCLYCYAAEGRRLPDQSQDLMGFDYAAEVMEEMKRCGAKECLLIGGEPTMYSKLSELVRFGTKLGLEMTLVSNGRKFADRRFVTELKEAGLAHASVSIEGATANKHDKITQSTSFEESCEGLKNLISESVSCNSVLTVSLLNTSEIVPLARLVHGFGTKNILYNLSLPSIGKDGVENCHSPNPQQYADLISEAYLQLKKEGISVGFYATVPLCLFDQQVLGQMMDDKAIGRNCHCHIFHGTGVAFEPNGNILPCTHFVNAPIFNAKGPDGHFVYKGSFDREWEEGTAHKKFIETVWKYPTEHCKSCSLWGKCVGGCPLLWLEFNPKDFIVKEVIPDEDDDRDGSVAGPQGER